MWPAAEVSKGGRVFGVESRDRRVQQITVVIRIRPPRSVALRIARETYETAALPLSYVGKSAIMGAALKQQLIALRGSLGVCSIR
jgi:hypothetical protein